MWSHEKTINHSILPHELKQNTKQVVMFEGLKVAHKQFTLEWQRNTTYRYVWWTQLALWFLVVGCTSRAHTQYKWMLAIDWEAKIKKAVAAIIMLATDKINGSIKLIQELRGKINHRGLNDFCFSLMHAWACAKSIQMKHSDENTAMSYRYMNRAM